jgi:RNA polymerase sigma-70 factor (ECF subfamily)
VVAPGDAVAIVFEEQCGYLFSIAYRILGSVSDAEDVVQDAFLRWQRDARLHVESPRAYLATIVVRLCMDQLRSARARREVYVGPWLPEPLITSDRADLTDGVVLRESLSFAFLLLLEALSPLERAVFVLREVFDYDYAEIAAMVDKSPANCRQIFHRARTRLAERQRAFEPDLQQQQQVTEQFLRATRDGDVHGRLALLTEDAVSISDGGGKVRAALRPVRTPENIVRGFLGNLAKLPPDRVWLDEVNGQPALVAVREGKPYGVLLLEVRGGRVQTLYAMVNPEKLHDLDRRIRTPSPLVGQG